jgi:hypothetical protein
MPWPLLVKADRRGVHNDHHHHVGSDHTPEGDGGVLAVGHHGEAAAPAGHTVDLSSYVLGDTLAAVPHFTCFILLLQMATR